MSKSSRSCLSGSLLRTGGGLIAIAVGLTWLTEVIQHAWAWIIAALLVVVAVMLVAGAVTAWWRGRNPWW